MFIEVYENAFGFAYPKVTDGYSRKGDVFFAYGRYDDALEFYKESFERSKLADEPNAFIIAQESYKVGRAKMMTGQINGALVYYNNALSLLDKGSDKNSSFVAVCYGSIGMAYYLLQDYKNALIFLKKSLKLFKSLPETDPKIITDCSSLIEEVKSKR